MSHLTLLKTDTEQSDFLAFHQSHFSGDAVKQFHDSFLRPRAQQEGEEGHDDDQPEEEDDLGYYDDGVKRTLTDEQIEIFRHSELEALRRERERGSKSFTGPANEISLDASEDQTEQSDQKDSQLLANSSSSKTKKKKNKGKRRGNDRRNVEPKPDLRKRTWDVVEAGLDSLEYD